METYYIKMTELRRNNGQSRLKSDDYVQVIDLNDLVKERVSVKDLVTVLDSIDCDILNAYRVMPETEDDAILICDFEPIFGVNSYVRRDEIEYVAFRAKPVSDGFYIYLKALGGYLLFLNRLSNAMIRINDLVFETGDAAGKVRVFDSGLTLQHIYLTRSGVYHLCVNFGCCTDFHLDVYPSGEVLVRVRTDRSHQYRTNLFTGREIFLHI